MTHGIGDGGESPPNHNDRLRVLMPSIVNPESERNGAATVTRGLMKALSLPALAAEVDCTPVRFQPPRRPQLRQFCSLVQASVSSLPSKVLFLRSSRYRRIIEERLRGQDFQLVVLNGGDLLWLRDYLPKSIPTLLVAHNIEHLLFQSQIQSLPWKPRPLLNLLNRDLRHLRKFERERLAAINNILFLSKTDAEFARTLSRHLNILTVPPVFDYPPAQRPERKPAKKLEIGYLGHFGWWPNRTGLRWFLRNVYPDTKHSLRLHLFGPASESVVSGAPGIVRHGIVDVLSKVWEECDILISPDFLGGGVSVKFAEAVYNGQPVLARRYAARGLELKDDPAIVLLDDPREWVEFLNSPSARKLAGSRVSAEVAKNFAIESHQDALHRFVGAVLRSAPSKGKSAGMEERQAT